MRRVISGGLALALAMVAASTVTSMAHAQDARGTDAARDAEARSLYEAGRTAFGDARYDDALRYFRQSYSLSGRPALLYNIGISADRLRRDHEAAEAFEQFLAAEPDSPLRREVEARLAAIRAQLEQEPQAPTPEQTASAATDTTPEETPLLAPAAAPMDDNENDAIYTKWWFWTAAGVVVAGGVVAAILLTNKDEKDEPLLEGDIGGVIYALDGP